MLCGYRLMDTMADELYENLPQGFSVLLLATQMELESCYHPEICKLLAPVQKSELVDSVRMLLDQGGVESAPVPKQVRGGQAAHHPRQGAADEPGTA